MKALFCPGPSYTDTKVRQFAGWVVILDLYREGLEELGYTVTVPVVDSQITEGTAGVSRVLAYGVVAAEVTRGRRFDLILGAPSYSLQAMMVHPEAKRFCYLWNGEDIHRHSMLAPEYKRMRLPYDTAPMNTWMNHTALKMADHLIACSPFVKYTHTQVVPEDKISIASWGVDSQRFTPAAKEPPGFRIIFVGGDPIRKGLVYLLEAVRDMPDVEVWIAGCAPFGGPDVKVDPRIRQFGMQPNSQMPEIYRECHVMCLPTLEDGIALAVQEAMASGLPVITSPETAEVFEDGKSGLKVEYRNVREIAAVLHTLKDKPELRQAMGREARALAETQTWQKTKEAFKEIIQREMAK